MEKAAQTLKTGWILLNLAHKYLDQFRRDAGLEKTQKHSFNFQVQRLEAIDRDLRSFTSPELSDIIRKEITDNWDNIALYNVLHIMSELPDVDRLKIENFAEEVYTTYLETNKNLNNDTSY